MTREDIIRLAREAGASSLHGGETALFGAAAIERFAALVEQHLIKKGYRKCAEGQRTTQFCGLFEDAVDAEREQWTAVVEQAITELEPVSWNSTNDYRGQADKAIAILRAAILARKKA